MSSVAITEEEQMHVIKCLLSPEYFVETFCWLEQKASAGVSEISSIIQFQLGEIFGDDFFFQRRMLRWLTERKNVLALKSRRVGASWIAAAYIAWLVLFHKGVNVLMISQTGRKAIKLLDKVKFIIKNLAFHDHSNLRKATKAHFLKPHIKTDNQQLFELGWRDESGEITTTSAVESLTTTDDSARSDDATLIVYDELAFYEHPDLTWSSSKKTLARGGHWIAISTPNGIGDVFHRLCARGDLYEMGKLNEPLGYEYIKIHWSEAGLTKEQVVASSVGDTQDLIDQEWEMKFIVPGSVVFHPTHLAACYKPPDEYPEIAAELAAYRQRVEEGKAYYHIGIDTIKGKASAKSKEKDWNSFNVFTQSNIQAFQYSDQSEISKWAGKNVDNVSGGRMEIEGLTTQLHKDWPGVANIEDTGVGLTTYNNHHPPRDKHSKKVGINMDQWMKRGIIERLVLKVEAHAITITDLKTYQEMMVYQNLDGRGKYGAPLNYNDDTVMTTALASNSVDKAGQLHFQLPGTNKLEHQSHPYQQVEKVKTKGPIVDIGIKPEHQRIADQIGGPQLPPGTEVPDGNHIKEMIEHEHNPMRPGWLR